MTTFLSQLGAYRIWRMPSGLTNALTTFQRTLNILVSRHNWGAGLVYLDDEIVSQIRLTLDCRTMTRCYKRCKTEETCLSLVSGASLWTA